MLTWIANVCTMAFQLHAIGVTVDDKDLILVLTTGLPRTYRTFVVSLNSTPANDLTLKNMISRLLDDKSCSYTANHNHSNDTADNVAASAINTH